MKIAGIVLFVHALLIAGLLYLHPPLSKIVPKHPLSVRTFELQEKTPQPPPTKPVVAPPTISKVPKPKAVVKKTPTPPSHRDELVRMMQHSLTSLKSTPCKTEAAPTPSLGPLASEALKFETSYRDKLIAFLEKALTLPESGEVKLVVTVSQSGHVKSVTIKESNSASNRAYVQKMIPSLLLPPLEKGENQRTFSLTLTSS